MGYALIFFLISLLILLHELGHFAAAKKFGLPVRIFSLGFGPRLWGKTVKGTDYRISAVPVGGYVLPELQESEEYFSLPLKSRLLFSLGGPTVNLAAAWVCLLVLNLWHKGVQFPADLILPFKQFGILLERMLAVIPALFRHPDQLSGVVGIVASGGGQGIGDFGRLMTLAAVLNLNLGVLNLLPIMPLDGGRIAMDLLHSLYPPLRRLHLPLALTGWALIIVLLIYITFNDVSRVLGMT